MSNVNARDVLVHRTADSDYLENADSALCQQFQNMIWNSESKLCSCLQNSTYYSLDSDIGCYTGNEVKSNCSLRFSQSPSKIYFIPSFNHLTDSIKQLGPFDNGKKITSECDIDIQTWNYTSWMKVTNIASKIKNGLLISFLNTDYNREIQGHLFKVSFSCKENPLQCSLFKVEGVATVLSIINPTAKPTEKTNTPANKADKVIEGVDNTVAIVLGVVVGVLLIFILTFAAYWFVRKRAKNTDIRNNNHKKKNLSRKSHGGGDENVYEDIGEGLYTDISIDRETYLSPIETLKRLSEHDAYITMRDRKSYTPTLKFDVNEPAPALPNQRFDRRSEKRHSYISTNDAEQSRRKEVYSILEETNPDTFDESETEIERYSSLEASALNKDEDYVALSLPKEGLWEPGCTNDVFNNADERVSRHQGLYDEVGTVFPNGSYDTTA